jgi:hypothetical protein
LGSANAAELALCCFPFCGGLHAAAGAAALTSCGFCCCCTTGLHGLAAFPSAQSEHHYIKKKDLGTINSKTPAQRPNMACLERKIYEHSSCILPPVTTKHFPVLFKHFFYFEKSVSQGFLSETDKQLVYITTRDGKMGHGIRRSSCMHAARPATGNQVGPRLDDQVINCRAKPTA